MHICYLCHEYPPGRGGGIGAFTRNMARGLAARGHNVKVAGVYREPATAVSEDEGVQVRRMAAARYPLTRFFLNGRKVKAALNEIHRRERLEIVEGQENAFASFTWRREASNVIRMHGGHHFFAATLGRKPAVWRGWQERRSFDHADAICAVSRYVAEATRELLNLGGRPITVLPNFVDTEYFRPAPGETGEGLIVFAGTVCEKKGIRQLIQAMPAIQSQAPAARLAVLGRDRNEGPGGSSFTAYLQSLIPESLRNSVAFQGPVPHEVLREYLARAEVCVYPSHMEAMPMAWLEAMSMGKAVVASSAGPGPEVIEDGMSGLLCDPHSPDAIAHCVIRCLRDPDLRARLGRAARRRAVEQFSIERMLDRNLEFYRQVIAGKAA